MKKILLSLLMACISVAAVVAQNNKVMLSEGCLFFGSKSYLEAGSYTTSQLGIKDNKLASFNLPKGMAIQLFESDQFTGKTETYYSSVACLSSAWRFKVSSIRIFNTDGGNTTLPVEDNSDNGLPAQGDRVIFYRDNKYSGMSRKMSAGSFSGSDLGFLSGQISSIYIPSGQSVTVSDNTGRTSTFNSSQSSLLRLGWDNNIISGSIQTAGSGGGNTLPPQGDQVIFYADDNYTGMARAFAKGSFSPGDMGFLQQNASSIYVPSGMTVKIYNNTGGNRSFTASVPRLSAYGWDNKVTTGIISGNASGGGTLPPQGDKVIFYRDMKYSGAGREYAAGTYGRAALGTLANNISSIYIPYGWSVMVSASNGSRQTFNSSMSNLAQYGWDNMISSVVISSGGQQGGNDPNPGNTVNLYTGTGYSGNVTPCGEGAIPNIGVGADNNISSIKVPAGYAVTVYDGLNLSGANVTFRASVTNLGSYGWNKKISSVYVFRL